MGKMARIQRKAKHARYKLQREPSTLESLQGRKT